MWWPVVFWLLLIPLLIVETIIFLRTRRLFWLIYALSIFTYVVAVSYTLDVFDAGRNAIIATLLASAALMAVIGRQLGRSVKKAKRISKAAWVSVIGIAAIIIVLFGVSVIMGVLAETVQPVPQVRQDALVRISDIVEKPLESGSITLLTRTYENAFFLPVPIPSGARYRACLDSNQGVYELGVNEYYESYPEVPPRSTRTADVQFMPIYLTKEQASRFSATGIKVYWQDDKRVWLPCDQVTDEPLLTIPVV